MPLTMASTPASAISASLTSRKRSESSGPHQRVRAGRTAAAAGARQVDHLDARQRGEQRARLERDLLAVAQVTRVLVGDADRRRRAPPRQRPAGEQRRVVAHARAEILRLGRAEQRAVVGHERAAAAGRRDDRPLRAGERAHRPVGELARAVEIAVVRVQRAAAALLGRRRDAVAAVASVPQAACAAPENIRCPTQPRNSEAGSPSPSPTTRRTRQAAGEATRGAALPVARRARVGAMRGRPSSWPMRRIRPTRRVRHGLPTASSIPRSLGSRAGPTASRACSSSAPYFTPAGHTGSQARQPRQNENSSRTSSSSSVPASSARMRLMRPRGEDASLRVSW